MDPERQAWALDRGTIAGMNSRKEHLDGLAVGILLACCLFWGLQQVLVKAIMNEVAPCFRPACAAWVPVCCC